MFLIDTDVSIWVLRGNLKVTNFVSRLKQKGSVGLSVITVAETYINHEFRTFFETPRDRTEFIEVSSRGERNKSAKLV